MENNNSKINKLRKFLIIIFLTVPIISSTISAFHLEKFLRLGNPTILSISTAFSYEIANLTTMFIFVLLPNINKYLLWISFILLIFMQIIGNVFFSFDYISAQSLLNPTYVDNWTNMIKIFVEDFDINYSKFILSCILGVPVPLVSLLLTKSVSNYLSVDTTDKIADIETVITDGKTEDTIKINDIINDENKFNIESNSNKNQFLNKGLIIS